MNNVILVWQFLRRYPVIPIFILVLLLISAAIGPYVTPYERDIGNIADRHLSLFSTSENTTVQVYKDDVVNVPAVAIPTPPSKKPSVTVISVDTTSSAKLNCFISYPLTIPTDRTGIYGIIYINCYSYLNWSSTITI